MYTQEVAQRQQKKAELSIQKAHSATTHFTSQIALLQSELTALTTPRDELQTDMDTLRRTHKHTRAQQARDNNDSVRCLQQQWASEKATLNAKLATVADYYTTLMTDQCFPTSHDDATQNSTSSHTDGTTNETSDTHRFTAPSNANARTAKLRLLYICLYTYWVPRPLFM